MFEPFLSYVFFKSVAVEWRAIIRFYHLQYSVGIKHSSEQGTRNCVESSQKPADKLSIQMTPPFVSVTESKKRK